MEHELMEQNQTNNENEVKLTIVDPNCEIDLEEAMLNMTKYFTTDQIDAIMILEECDYNITTVAERLNIPRTTIYSWRNRNPYFRKAINMWKEYYLSVAMRSALRLVNAGDVSMTKFFLQNLSKEFNKIAENDNIQINNIFAIQTKVEEEDLNDD